MQATIWALLPPVIAIVLALITKEVYISLIIGIITGAVLLVGITDPIGVLNMTFDTMKGKIIGIDPDGTYVGSSCVDILPL